MAAYKPYRGKHSIKPITINREIVIGRVARHWGMKPWEFRKLAANQAAELHALYDIEQEIELYRNSEERRISDQETSRDRGSSKAFGKRGFGRR